MPYRYETAKKALENIIKDMRILAGDEVGPSDVSWQDVAGTLSCNLQVLSAQIDFARVGQVVNGPAVFPSPDDFILVHMGKDEHDHG